MFTVKGIEALKPQDKRYEIFSKGEKGFGLRVFPSGVKIFFTRYKRPDGKQIKITINETTLAKARKKHQDYRELIRTGNDPKDHDEQIRLEKLRQHRAELEADTVGSLIDEFVNHLTHKLKRKRPEYAQAALDRNIRPAWEERKVKDITRRDAIKLLERIADRGSPVMANRVAALVKQMFNYAVESGIIEDSPVAVLTRPGGNEAPRKVNLSRKEIKQFWHKLDDADMTSGIKLALKVLLLTGQRRGEIAQAEWSEIDFKNNIWIIPADKSKNGMEHLIPLAPDTSKLFKELKLLAGKSRYVLPTRIGKDEERKAITPASITRAVKRNQPIFKVTPFTTHDLRRTVATQMRKPDIAIQPWIVERVLNHKERGVQKHYDQHEYLEEKDEALRLWAEKVDGILAGKIKDSDSKRRSNQIAK